MCVLEVLAAVFAFIAAVTWACAALTKVKVKEETNEAQWQDAQIINGDSDFIATVKRQSRLNALAALFSALSAVFMGISLLACNR